MVGDFNLPDVDWSTLSASTDFSNQFCDLVFQHNLLQLVNNPTHVCGNILDLVLTNSDDMITSLSVDPIMSPHLQSDHYRVSFNIATSLHCLVKNPTYLCFWLYQGWFPQPLQFITSSWFLSLSTLRRHRICLELHKIWDLQSYASVYIFLKLNCVHISILNGSHQLFDISLNVFVLSKENINIPLLLTIYLNWKYHRRRSSMRSTWLKLTLNLIL